MINKSCAEHPELIPLIFDSGNQTHTAGARCPQCDRFLGWIGRRDLSTYIDEMSAEIARLRAILELGRFKSQGAEAKPLLDTDGLDLEVIWARLLAQLQPATRDLFKPFAELESIAGDTVKIRMKSPTMRSIATAKVPELTKVFSQSLGQTIAIELTVKPREVAA
jgi:hypothetical protein